MAVRSILEAAARQGDEIGQKLLDMALEARMKRAREMGYNVDETWYHGANRIDRVLEKDSLNPKRATSGPMPFFTDDPALASSYAKGKTDTSMADVDTDYANWFKVSAGPGKPKRVTDAWYYLDPEERAVLSERLPRIALDDEGEKLVMADGLSSRDHWDYTLRQNNNNPIAAAKDLWLDGGTIYGREEQFADVLRMGGLKRPIKWDSPHMDVQGVLPVYAKVQNPLDTSNTEALQTVLERLKVAGKGKRYKRPREGVDLWDKRNIGIKEFAERLERDLADGTTQAWTSIPDEVTDELRRMGYDGVRDTGGKGGGVAHNVLIPFEPNQVRSVNAAFDPAKADSPNLLAGGAAAAVGLGAATGSEDSEAGVITRGGKKLLEFWHGSPHKFDRFDMSKIGTGEGAQAYGHGLYGADSRDVAVGYRDSLTGRIDNAPTATVVVDGKPFVPASEDEARAAFIVARDGRKSAQQVLRAQKSEGITSEETIAAYESVLRQTKGKDVSLADNGSLYRVEADIDPDMLLDWDRPLSEQSEGVQRAFRQLPDPKLRERIFGKTNLGNELTGGQAYGVVQDYFRNGRPDNIFDGGTGALGQADASAELQYLGIPGIRYLDGMSRNAGEGSYNYVMFDDKPLRIVERGNINPILASAMAGVSAGGITAASNDRISLWDQIRDGTSQAIGGMFDAIDMPWRGYLGGSRLASGLFAGEDFDTALNAGVRQIRQPVDVTASEIGGEVTDQTGSPAAGTASYLMTLLGGPI